MCIPDCRVYDPARGFQYRPGPTLRYEGGTGRRLNWIEVEVVVFKRAILKMTILGLLAFPAGGFGAEATGPPASAPMERNEVTIRILPESALRCNEAFDPAVIRIKAGTTVVWINEDRETHTIVSSDESDPCNPPELPPEDRKIDAGQISYRQRFEMTFTEPGEYPYTCHLPFHRMTGKIVVLP